MKILNQLIVRFPKWVVSWILVIADSVIGLFLISKIFVEIDLNLVSISIFTIFIITQLFWCLMFWASNLYNGDAEVSRFVEAEKLIKLTFFIMASSIFLLGIDVNLGPLKSEHIIKYWLLFTFLVVMNRWFIRSIQKFLLKKGYGQHNVIIIGSGERSLVVTNSLKNHEQNLYNILGCIKTDGENEQSKNFSIPILGQENKLKEIIVKYPVADIVIALDNMEHYKILKIISVINGSPISVKIVPDLYEVVSGLARTEQISGLPLIEVNFKEGRWSGSGLKRFFDFFISGISLIVLSPFMFIISAIIKINSKGPAIYTQQRLGFKGKPFNIYKFRSMIMNAEKDSGPVWTLDNDPRVTSFGKILRKFRVDEIPQLFNVFLGHMSLIGPRPERPFFTEKLKEKFPLYERRFSVRPGITGWSQIKHPSDTEEEDVRKKLKYDFYYIENISLKLDLKILASTIIVVLSGKGR